MFTLEGDFGMMEVMFVLLLKTISLPYSDALAPAYNVVYLPVLTTQQHNRTRLGEILQQPQQHYTGVVITSHRAIHACSLLAPPLHLPPHWNTTTWFVIGPATANALKQLLPRANIKGHKTGNAISLANCIINHLNSSTPSTLEGNQQGSKGILHLTGDKNLSTLPDLLRSSGIPIELLQVYSTTLDPDFESQLDALVERLVQAHEEECWFVMFSPSGSKAALEIMRKKPCLLLPLIDPPPPPPFPLSTPLPTCPPFYKTGLEGEEKDEGIKIKVKLAVIGPTTRAYLETEEHYYISADSNSPEPIALLRALEASDR